MIIYKHTVSKCQNESYSLITKTSYRIKNTKVSNTTIIPTTMVNLPIILSPFIKPTTPSIITGIDKTKKSKEGS